MSRAAMTILSLAAGTLALLSFATPGADAPKAPKEIVPKAPCATDVCHADLKKAKVLHGPVADGDCTTCHEPKDNLHQFSYPEKGDKLCAICHDDVKEKKKVVHKALEEGCVTCHSPHGGDTKALLVAPVLELCETCHDETVGKARKATTKHSPTLTGKNCQTCHAPHASNTPKLLLVSQKDTCLKCHGDKIEADGRTIAGVKDQITDKETVHAPIEDGECNACHGVHGSNHAAMLKSAYPKDFYSPFSAKNYAVCFECHDATLVTSAKTEKDTEFRNGSQNLHSLHVDRENKGRTCRACHAEHGSAAPHLVRDTVPFGPKAWPLPIRYQATKTGGSCAPGCHRPKPYDRKTPMDYSAPQETPAEEKEPAPAAEPGAQPKGD